MEIAISLVIGLIPGLAIGLIAGMLIGLFANQIIGRKRDSTQVLAEPVMKFANDISMFNYITTSLARNNICGILGEHSVMIGVDGKNVTSCHYVISKAHRANSVISDQIIQTINDAIEYEEEHGNVVKNVYLFGYSKSRVSIAFGFK